ncbi:GNAT family N-acetyltransferase [Urbifossiella limnaea]|uniref:FG-GAP repeat protein n=1 Tax=Urbifossiella limnaea TaxID=2528023 RepID=A0A517XRV8_9BACT|nr:GNAT family N-acetyltransferase [Urbifossiella limnaea]QDU20248.1 FG-GAP repeat protein [Urbifossiella limnaea]
MLTIRPARESDVAALVALARRSWVGAFAAAPAAFVRDRLAREFERDWYPRYWPDMAVAEEGGVVVGVVQPAGDEVNGLWVAPAAQGRGVGTALLRHAERGIAAAGHGRRPARAGVQRPRQPPHQQLLRLRPSFSGGVTVAAGDVNGDGRADIITGAGFGGGPHVQVFDGVDVRVRSSFFAYEDTVRNGIFVAAGDFDGDGLAEVLTGPGAGGGPAARVFEAETGAQLASFFAFPPAAAQNGAPWQSGLRVAATRRAGVAADVLAVGTGPGTSPDNTPRVRLFTLDGAQLDEILTDDPTFLGGVFVGG